MCCLVCILILSLPLCAVSSSFKFRLSFCKGGVSLFSCAHPGAYTLLLETFSSWRAKTTKNLRKYKEHLGLKYNHLTALSQSPPESEDVLPVDCRWILVRSASCWCKGHSTHLSAGTAGHCHPHTWLVPVCAGGVHVFEAVSVLLPQNGSSSQKKCNLAISISSWMKIGKQNEAAFGGWLGDREGVTSAFAHLRIPKLYSKNAASQAVYPQNQHTRDKKSNYCTCTVPTFPQKLSGCVLCHGSITHKWLLQLIHVCVALLGLCVIQTSIVIRLCLPELFLCYRLWVTSWMLMNLSAGLSKSEAASDLRSMSVKYLVPAFSL